MTNFKKYIISFSLNIKEALLRLNELSSDILTLFVVDEREKILGTLTDGDIRRGLIKGIELTDSVKRVMRTDFSFIDAEKIDLIQLRACKGKAIQLLPMLDSERKIVNIINLKTKKSLLQLDAILMAGGRGERLRPLTDTTPKPLLKIGDKFLIDYNIDNLISYGIENLYITVHYLSDQVIQHVQRYSRDINIVCIMENTPLGTFGSIKRIDTIKSDNVLIMNADLFTNIDYEDFFIYFLESNADMAIATVPYNVNIPYAILEAEGDSIKGLKEKPIITYYANAGIYLIKSSLIPMIPDSFFNATDFIQLLINSRKNIIKYPLIGYWFDVGKPEDYKMVQAVVKHTKT